MSNIKKSNKKGIGGTVLILVLIFIVMDNVGASMNEARIAKDRYIDAGFCKDHNISSIERYKKEIADLKKSKGNEDEIKENLDYLKTSVNSGQRCVAEEIEYEKRNNIKISQKELEKRADLLKQ